MTLTPVERLDLALLLICLSHDARMRGNEKQAKEAIEWNRKLAGIVPRSVDQKESVA